MTNYRFSTIVFTDETGAEFYSFNLVLGDDDKGQFIYWGRTSFSYEELNEFNGKS